MKWGINEYQILTGDNVNQNDMFSVVGGLPEVTDSATYLGITATNNDLKNNKLLDRIAKAGKTLGMLLRGGSRKINACKHHGTRGTDTSHIDSDVCSTPNTIDRTGSYGVEPTGKRDENSDNRMVYRNSKAKSEENAEMAKPGGDDRQTVLQDGKKIERQGHNKLEK